MYESMYEWVRYSCQVRLLYYSFETEEYLIYLAFFIYYLDDYLYNVCLVARTNVQNFDISLQPAGHNCIQESPHRGLVLLLFLKKLFYMTFL